MGERGPLPKNVIHRFPASHNTERRRDLLPIDPPTFVKGRARRKVYREIVGSCRETGALEAADAHLVELLADLILQRRELRNAASYGLSAGSTGQPKIDPRLVEANRLTSDIVNLAAQLAMSPKSRRRLELEPPAEEDDGMADILAGISPP